ncbi:hypothetical protein BH10PLA2_BH10PLA2_17730 [soil metagenome]
MTAELQVLVRHVRRMAGRCELANLSDRDLLQKYGRENEDEAFTILVTRHAELVAGVCRRILRHEQDIEDTFQATFQVLCRRSRSHFLPASLAGWLHRVAYHLAIRARRRSLRIRLLETSGHNSALDVPAPESRQPASELREMLDKELVQLPSASRRALVLCYLEGQTRDQAAHRIGCSLRTLDRRMEDGRRRLRGRLARRGLDLSVVLLGLGLSKPAKAATAQLVSMTIRNLSAHAVSSGGKAGLASGIGRLWTGILWRNTGSVFGGCLLAVVVTAIGAVCWMTGTALPSTPEVNTEALVGNTIDQRTPRRSAPNKLVGEKLPIGAVARLGDTRFRVGNAQKLSYSPDGTKLYAGSSHGIRVFDSKTGLVIRNIDNGLNRSCGDTLVSQDGKVAAFCVSNRPALKMGVTTTIEGPPDQVLLFDTTTGKLICSIGVDIRSPKCLGGFSSDASLLAIAKDRSTVELYDAKRGQLLRSFSWPPTLADNKSGFNSGCSFLDVAFSSDGQKLYATSHSAGLIHIFDVATGAELKQLKIRGKGIAGMKLSPDGSRLAILESEFLYPVKNSLFDAPGNRVLILESAYGRQLAEFTTQSNIYNFAFSPAGHSLTASTEKHGTSLWSADSGKLIRSLLPAENTAELCAPVISPDGKWLARASAAVIRISSMDTGTELPIAPGHSGLLTSIATNPSKSVIATAGSDGRVLLWERNSGRLLREQFAGTGSAASLRYSPDGRSLFGITNNMWNPLSSTIRCWDARTGKEIWKLADHPVHPLLLAVSPNNKLLAGLGKSSALLIDAETGVCSRVLTAADGEDELSAKWFGSPASIAFNLDGDELVAWGKRKGLHRWTVANGVLQLSKIENPWSHLTVFSPDANHVAVSDYQGAITLSSTTGGKKVILIKNSPAELGGELNGAAFSDDGRQFACANPFDRQLQIVDLVTGNTSHRWTSPTGLGSCLAFTSDDKNLVTDGGDGTALLWDLSKIPLVEQPPPQK